MVEYVKRSWSTVLLATLLACTFFACKSKVSDADLKAKIESVIVSSPNVVVGVTDGVVTLSGTVATEQEKAALADAAKNADSKSVKSVINDLMVDAAPIETSSDDADLITKVIDASKDFPNIKVDVKDGIIKVTGDVEQSRVQTLKMALDALNPKKVDMSGLTVK